MTIKNEKILREDVLKNTGIKNKNSTSYKTKKMHISEKFRLNCISTSVLTLKPHS